MNELENTENVENVNINQMFYDTPAAKSKEVFKESSKEAEFTSKSSNRSFKQNWDIHFAIGAGTFGGLISYISEIDYNVAFCFRKKEIMIVAIDPGDSHGSVIKIDNIEMTSYTPKLEKDDSEKWILIDTSVITDELMIIEDKQLDMYIDTLDKNRFYVINGKEQVERQLNSTTTSDGADELLARHKRFASGIQKLTGDERYQKVVVNYVPLMGVMKSLLKKTDKSKDASTLCSLVLTKYDLDFRIESGVKSSSIMLYGEDMVVYPLKEDVFKFNLKFFNKIGRLKFTYGIDLYINGQIPMILTSRLGGGNIRVWFLIAPRLE